VSEAPAPPRAPRLQFAAMLTGFVVFTALGAYWAAPGRETLARSGRELAGLGWANVVFLGASAASILGAEMIRLDVFGRVLGVRVGLRAAFDASIANDLFSWISPGAMLGEPAAVYVMARRGVPVDAALVISFGKFATSFAFIMGAAGLLVAAGFGPEISGWAVISIVATIGVGVVIVGSFTVGAMFPAATLRAIDAAEAWAARRRLARRPWGRHAISASAGVARRSVERLARFRRGGAAGWLAMMGSHVVYYGSYIGLLVLLGHLFGAPSLGAVVPAAIVYQAFTYIAPAPGIPEAGAAAFFGALLPGGEAFVVVLLFRALTAYFQVALGLVYLPVIGALRAIVERRPA
jgi:uncharacterized membrane protein YbhN (UPF0104 family)